MKILYLTAFFPFPAISGGRLRVKNLLEGFSKSHEVHLLSIGFEEADKRAERQRLAKDYCASAVVVPHLSRRVPAALKTLATGRPYELNLLWNKAYAEQLTEIAEKVRPDIVWCSRIATAQYLPIRLNPLLNSLIVLDQHDLTSYLWSLIQQNSSQLWMRVFGLLNKLAVRRFENRIYRNIDVCISVSEHERQLTARIAPPSAKLLVVPNGVDTAFFAPNQHVPEDDLTVSMVGQMNGVRNIDAALFFADEILPKIRQQHPQVEFMVVGANPDAKIKRLGERPGITVTGYVDDVRPYTARSAVIVLPHRFGSGVKHKLPIAMAMAKPVVTTTNGCQGIAIQDGINGFVRDDASDFASAVSKLLSDRALRNRVGQQARRLVEEQYDWKSITARLDADIRSIYEQFRRNRP